MDRIIIITTTKRNRFIKPPLFFQYDILRKEEFIPYLVYTDKKQKKQVKNANFLFSLDLNDFSVYKQFW